MLRTSLAWFILIAVVSACMCVTFYGALGCANAPTDAARVNGCSKDLEAAQCAAEGLTYPATCDW